MDETATHKLAEELVVGIYSLMQAAVLFLKSAIHCLVQAFTN